MQIEPGQSQKREGGAGQPDVWNRFWVICVAFWLCLLIYDISIPPFLQGAQGSIRSSPLPHFTLSATQLRETESYWTEGAENFYI